MKNKRCLITIIFILFLLSACEKEKEYVYFNFGCGNTEYYKCELKKNKLNCDVKSPTCEGKAFLGWYEANNYDDKLDLYGTFLKDTIIYARWKDEDEEIFSRYIEEPSVTEDEPSSIIEGPSSIEESSFIVEEPSSTNDVKTYTITFVYNNGDTIINRSVKYAGMLPNIGDVPTKTGYTFMGWYDNPDYTKGIKYYNQTNLPVKIYTNKANITLYAGWKLNVLSIEYNGNSGTWNITSGPYSMDINGTVILKEAKKIYQQKLNYGGKLTESGLVDYNGNLFNWKKKNYKVEPGKEYYIQTGTSRTELNQKKVYTAKELASYAGCDLSKKDCTIIVKVNWKINGWSIYTDYGQGSWIYHDASKNELRKYYNSSYALLPFMEYVPEKVVSSGDSVPLIIWLHGLGEVGSTVDRLKDRGLIKVVSEWNKTGLKNIPAIIIAPHLIKNMDSWTKFEEPTETIRALVTYAKEKYNINTNKVILVGHSLGGSGVEGMNPKNYDLFSALIVFSGYYSGVNDKAKEYYKKMPMKGFSEPHDSAEPPIETGELMRKFFSSCDHLKDLTIYPNASHGGVPKLALTEDKNNDKISDLIYWALSQNKKSD